MAYEFKDFGQRATATPLSIRSIIDGTQLEERFNSASFRFTTLTVRGRGAVPYRIDSEPVYGRHGEMLKEKVVGSRTIVIKAKVSASTNENYRKGMSDLNAMFFAKKIQAIKFTDDNSYTYYGTCQRVEDEGEESNTQIIEIELLLTDVFKYTNVKTVSTTNAQRITVDSDFPVVPEEIAITFSSATAARDFSLNNTTSGMRIRYQQDGTASGTSIRIRQKDNYIGYVDSVNHISGLNVAFSYFDEFTVANNDQISVTPTPTNITIKYRGVRL